MSDVYSSCYFAIDPLCYFACYFAIDPSCYFAYYFAIDPSCYFACYFAIDFAIDSSLSIPRYRFLVLFRVLFRDRFLAIDPSCYSSCYFAYYFAIDPLCYFAIDSSRSIPRYRFLACYFAYYFAIDSSRTISRSIPRDRCVCNHIEQSPRVQCRLQSLIDSVLIRVPYRT